MVDISHGKVRVRAWPRKRGKPKTVEHLTAIQKFAAAQRVWRYIAPQYAAMIYKLTATGPLLPRDILTMCLYNRAYWIQWPRNKRWYPLPYVTDVSAALDAITQTEGATLVRGKDRWEGGTGGGGGSPWELLYDGPAFTVPASQSTPAVEVRDYTDIQIVLRNIVMSGNAIARLNVSLNDGASWLGDSRNLLQVDPNGGSRNDFGAPCWSSSGNTKTGIIEITGNCAGGWARQANMAIPGEQKLLPTNAAIITHVRAKVWSAPPVINGGTMTVIGRK